MKKEEEVKKPELPKKEVDEKLARISTYNGDVTDKYSWSQGITEVVV